MPKDTGRFWILDNKTDSDLNTCNIKITRNFSSLSISLIVNTPF